jgi:hypothetical protein
MTGDGETHERTWMYISPRMEDFLEGQNMGREGCWEEEGVETRESDWAEDLLELGVRRAGVSKGEGLEVVVERQGGATRGEDLRRFGGERGER